MITKQDIEDYAEVSDQSIYEKQTETENDEQAHWIIEGVHWVFGNKSLDS